MLFFQLALLAGYAYADLVIRKLSPRQLAVTHTVLLLASLAWLPIGVRASLQPADASEPIVRILLLLSASIGLPYLVLSTSGPLIQAWWARSSSSVKVYRLYALSNLASMSALIAYPPLIEPYWGLQAQTTFWSAAYALFVILAIACAWLGARQTAVPPTIASASVKPGAAQQLMWLLLAAFGSITLLSVTSQLTQNVAPIPFLWVLPLAIYLLTFILCFDGSHWYWRRTYLVLAAVSAPLMIAGLDFDVAASGISRSYLRLEVALPLYAGGLFIICMFLHGELTRRKPEPQWLTRFYLMVAIGGAAGGIVVGIAAPLLLSYYWELPFVLAAVMVLIYLLANSRLRWVGAGSMCVCAVLLTMHIKFNVDGVLYGSRNFYGTLRVINSAEESSPSAGRALLHGAVLHGQQFAAPNLRRLPTAYYGENSGVGRAFAHLDRRQSLRVGLVGLGVGTVLTYGRSGDVFRLYELDPDVLAIARRSFSYVSDSAATIETRLGDARLSLQREPPQRFNLLVVDAFSGDAVPIHLINLQAVELYTKHLAAHGILAFHVTNQYLDLATEVRQLAQATGMHSVMVVDNPADTTIVKASAWLLLAVNRDDLPHQNESPVAEHVKSPSPRIWTDDYSNLYRALRRP